jgi:hypothetical protein
MDEKALLDRLDRHNDIMQKMLDIMPRPAGKFTSALETIVLIAGALTLVGIAETIVKWITGG